MAKKIACNVENVLKLADALEQGRIKEGGKRVGFNMNLWRTRSSTFFAAVNWRGRKCNTVACIGGSAELLFQSDDARDALGLSERNAKSLFYPNRRVVKGEDWPRISPSAAAEVLRHLAAKGEIDWARAIKLHPLVETVAS